MQVLRHIPATRDPIIVFFEIFGQIIPYIFVLALVIVCFANSFLSISMVAAEGTKLDGV